MPDTRRRSGWQAHLGLTFRTRGARTVLVRRDYAGPLVVQKPFYPEGAPCHVYLIHPPGGVVAGDRLRMDLDVEPHAHAVVTTPAAGKFYRSEGAVAHQAVRLAVASQGRLEWLPQETLLFEGTRVDASVDIALETGARFIGWEVMSFGRPAINEGFSHGRVDVSWRITQDGAPFYVERMAVDPEAFKAVWGLQGHAAVGAMFATPATPKHLEMVRSALGDARNVGVTLLDGVLICKVLGMRADLIRAQFEHVWHCLRPDTFGCPSCPPRIWST